VEASCASAQTTSTEKFCVAPVVFCTVTRHVIGIGSSAALLNSRISPGSRPTAGRDFAHLALRLGGQGGHRRNVRPRPWRFITER
jgi:hypothetical protein